jgi:endonuclease/exonuclease/phosphatase family metal-dependent hydrolase
MTTRLRVVTYNIHKCRGLDRRVAPDRIARVLSEFDADVIALQEILDARSGKPEWDQARRIHANSPATSAASVKTALCAAALMAT